MSKSRRTWFARERWRRVTKIAARTGMTCPICGESMDRSERDPLSPRYITFDHIVPRCQGGNDSVGNLRLAHQACNNARGFDPISVADEEERF